MTLAYLGTSGIVLGQTDAAGVRWKYVGGDPWSPGPNVRAVTGDRATDHGSWDATEFYASRNWALEGSVHAPDHLSLHQAKQRFFAAVRLRLFGLRFVEPGFDRTGQFRRDGEVLWSEFSNRGATFSAPLFAPDPRAYSTLSHTALTGFPSSVGGLTWPATWPATWGAVVTSGDLSMFNAGDDTAWPTFRIDGPVDQPVIVNANTGDAMHLDLTLGAGEWVTMNTATHQVLANGDTNASRRDKFWGTWWGLAPGANTVRFFGASAGAGAQLSATWNDTWL